MARTAAMIECCNDVNRPVFMWVSRMDFVLIHARDARKRGRPSNERTTRECGNFCENGPAHAANGRLLPRGGCVPVARCGAPPCQAPHAMPPSILALHVPAADRLTESE